MNINMTDIVCGSCGIPHSFPTVFYESLQQEGGFWTCPNGHKRGWEKGSIELELKICKKDYKNMSALFYNGNQAYAQLDREYSNLKGQLTKTKNKLKKLQTI